MASQTADTTDNSVEVMPPNFALQRMIGGSASRFLTPLTLQRAQKSIAAILPQLVGEVTRLMAELETAVRSKEATARDSIWEIAHELRGLAGTAGKARLGIAADLICRYLEGTDSTFTPDAKVLSTIAIVAAQAVKEGADTDPMTKMLLVDGARAVLAQRRREGRGVPD